jgi:hypothetical protein
MIIPILSYGHTHFKLDCRDMNLVAIVAEAENLRKKVMEATNYSRENFVLEDSNGRPALTLLWSSEKDGTLSCWSVRTGLYIGAFKPEAWDEDNRDKLLNTLDEWCDKANQGMARCSECGQWVNAYKKYSYTGSVCLKCYNPKKHLPPDSSG